MKNNICFFTGNESFADLINTGAYYVDKTAYLKDLFLGKSVVMNPLFIRPRRFGKTLNMSMIKEFCELNYQTPGDKSYQQQLFIDNGRKLAVAGDEYKELREQIMGEFPVISISFKGVEGSSFNVAVSCILRKISELYSRFMFLTASVVQQETDKKELQHIYDFCKTEYGRLYKPENLAEALAICSSFISTLAQMLYREYGRKVIVIIDEYDVPLQKAVVAKEPYYDDMLEIIRQLSVSTFKQEPDPWLYKGIVSGCLKIAHQSVFTDANNFTIFDTDNEPYTGFFGFTREETLKLLCDCGLSDKESEVGEWYDGYRFGKNQIYCPWSMTSYCFKAINGDEPTPEAFWVNTSGNDIITLFTQNSMESHDAGNIEKLQALIDGKDLEITLREFSTYPDLRVNMDFDVFMTLMLHTGYVTFTEDSPFTGRVRIRIPNREVLSCFEEKRNYLFSKNNPFWYSQTLKLVDLLMENKVDEAQLLMSSMLKEFLSIRNTGSEHYYHGFMLGIASLAASTRGIEVISEAESGDGYADLILKHDSSDTVAVIEFKKGLNTRSDRIKAAQEAVRQILKKKYAEPYLLEEYSKVYGLGIGFGGKECYVSSLGNLQKRTSK